MDKKPKEPVIEWLLSRVQEPSQARAVGLCYRADIHSKTPMTVLRIAVEHMKGGGTLVFYVPESNPQRWWVEEGSYFLHTH